MLGLGVYDSSSEEEMETKVPSESKVRGALSKLVRC